MFKRAIIVILLLLSAALPIAYLASYGKVGEATIQELPNIPTAYSDTALAALDSFYARYEIADTGLSQEDCFDIFAKNGLTNNEVSAFCTVMTDNYETAAMLLEGKKPSQEDLPSLFQLLLGLNNLVGIEKSTFVCYNLLYKVFERNDEYAEQYWFSTLGIVDEDIAALAFYLRKGIADAYDVIAEGYNDTAELSFGQLAELNIVFAEFIEGLFSYCGEFDNELDVFFELFIKPEIDFDSVNMLAYVEMTEEFASANSGITTKLLCGYLRSKNESYYLIDKEYGLLGVETDKFGREIEVYGDLTVMYGNYIALTAGALSHLSVEELAVVAEYADRAFDYRNSLRAVPVVKVLFADYMDAARRIAGYDLSALSSQDRRDVEAAAKLYKTLWLTLLW